jgi:hypothetical protein
MYWLNITSLGGAVFVNAVTFPLQAFLIFHKLPGKACGSNFLLLTQVKMTFTAERNELQQYLAIIF